MKKRYLIVWAALGAAFLLAGSTGWLIDALTHDKPQLSNEESTTIEVGLSIFITLAFYLIQYQREVKRKIFWLNIVIGKLNAIIDAHYAARTSCEKVLSNNDRQSVLSERENLSMILYQIESWHVPKINQAMTQVADLLDEQAIFETITHDNYNQFKLLIMLAKANLHDVNKTDEMKRLFTEYVEVLKKYVEAIEKEKPSVKL